MTNQHPITPPPELVQQWVVEYASHRPELPEQIYIATRAAQWGADQELLACGNHLKQCSAWEEEDVTEFYNYRRPRPPSLKEQALDDLHIAFDRGCLSERQADTIRRALEQLND